MRGLMQDWPLLCNRMIDHAAAIHGGQEVVNADQEGKRAAREICAALGIRVRADSPMMAGHL